MYQNTEEALYGGADFLMINTEDVVCVFYYQFPSCHYAIFKRQFSTTFRYYSATYILSSSRGDFQDNQRKRKALTHDAKAEEAAA